MSDDDYVLALKLQKQYNEENFSTPRKSFSAPIKKQPTTSLVDPEWEITDPNPDIHMLFGVFNAKYFWNALGAVEVKWSPRMYMCAGICTYKGKAGCVVSLSLPLLKFRPRKDLVETLLHEMIHAYLFVTKNNIDRSSHGPEFCKHMGRINKEAGTNITIYHSFHDEVNHYRTHVWRCNGSCKANPPYFGYVRRATNRAPGPNDFWFTDHQRSCGGSFDKVGEPDGFVAKPRKKLKTEQTSSDKVATSVNKTPPSNSIMKFFTSTPSNSPQSSSKINNSGKLGDSPIGRSLSKVAAVTKTGSNSKTVTSGLANTVHGIQSKSNQGDLVVKHGGVKNNIFGFGNLSGENTSKSQDDKKDNFKIPVVPFAGKGHVLGSSGSNDKTKSRLLSGLLNGESNKKDLNSAPSTSTHAEEIPVHFEDLTGFEDDFDSPTFISSSDDEAGVLCPVCNAVIKQGVSMNEHLDECSILESVFNSSRHDTLSDSDSDDDNSSPTFASPVKPSSPPVNCPNCNTVQTASTINQHLDGCLSFE